MKLIIEKSDLLECIPGYTPSPCDCCAQIQTPPYLHYVDGCDCGNPGDTIEAAGWCERMNMADKLDALLEELSSVPSEK